MRKWIAGAAVAAALIGGGSAVAVATTHSSGHSSDTSTTVASPPSDSGSTPAKGKGAKHDKQAKGAMKPRALLKGAVAMAAKTIGIDPKELAADLKAGQSISDVAAAHNVDRQKVIDAMVAAGNAKVDQAVTANKLTADQAAKIKAKLPTLVAKLVDRHKAATPSVPGAPAAPSGPSAPAQTPSTTG